MHAEDIRKDGYLLKQSKVLKNWHKRWLVLTPQYLFAFKTQQDQRQVTEFIKLTECSSVKSADQEMNKEHCFSVVTPSRTFFLIASSATEKAAWMDCILNCCCPSVLSDGEPRNCIPLSAINEGDDEDAAEAPLNAPQRRSSGMTRTPSAMALINNSLIPKVHQCLLTNQQCFHFPRSLPEPCGVCGHSPAVCVFLATMRSVMRGTPSQRSAARQARATDRQAQGPLASPRGSERSRSSSPPSRLANTTSQPNSGATSRSATPPIPSRRSKSPRPSLSGSSSGSSGSWPVMKKQKPQPAPENDLVRNIMLDF